MIMMLLGMHGEYYTGDLEQGVSRVDFSSEPAMQT